MNGIYWKGEGSQKNFWKKIIALQMRRAIIQEDAIQNYLCNFFLRIKVREKIIIRNQHI